MPVAVRLGNPNPIPPFYQVELQLGGDAGDEFREYGLLPDSGTLPMYQTSLATTPDGEWSELTFDLSYATKPILVVTVNGQTVLAAPHNDLTQFQTPTHQMLTIGIIAGVGSGSWEILFDNAVCDPLQP
jgi:hypothetical protein